jgi:hypothetical protein
LLFNTNNDKVGTISRLGDPVGFGYLVYFVELSDPSPVSATGSRALEEGVFCRMRAPSAPLDDKAIFAGAIGEVLPTLFT